jgi:acyl-CoA-binding protein
MVNKLKSHVTSSGIFKYPHLQGQGDTKFNPEGQFKVTLVWENGDATDFCSLIDESHKKSIEQAKLQNKGKSIKTANVPYKLNEDKKVEATFKLNAVGKSSKTGNTWTQKPAIFDAKGNPMELKETIWGGTKGKISFQIVPYYTAMIGAGVSLRLKACQVLDLVTGQVGGDSFGFSEEDGYEYKKQSKIDAEWQEKETNSEDF